MHADKADAMASSACIRVHPQFHPSSSSFVSIRVHSWTTPSARKAHAPGQAFTLGFYAGLGFLLAQAIIGVAVLIVFGVLKVGPAVLP